MADLITSNLGVKFTLTNVFDLTYCQTTRLFLSAINTPPNRRGKSLKMSGALGCTTVIIRTSKPTISGFEKFPREIRDMIYELCLCVDGILDPYPEWFTSDHIPKIKGRKPEVALLALNKQIRDEALPILFGKNTWRITAKKVNLAEKIARRLGHGEVDSLWDQYGSHIQKVDLKYTRTQHPPESFEEHLYYAYELYPDDTLEDRSARADTIHEYVTDDLKPAWVVMINALDCCPNIETIHIDTGNLYCPIGCCRTNIVRNLFAKYMAEVKAGVEVSVSGIFDEEERGYVVAWRTGCGNGKEKDEAMAHTQISVKGFNS